MDPNDQPVPPSAPEPETNPAPPAGPSAEPAPANNPPVSDKPYKSAFSLFKPSWAALKLNIGTFLALSIVPLILGIVGMVALGGIGASASDKETVGASLALTGLAVFSIIYLILAPAITYTQVQSVQGQKTTLKSALSNGMHAFWRYWGTLILSGLMVLGGLILLIVPGIFMIRRYMLAPYVVFTENLGVTATLKRSAEVSKQYSGAVWGILGVTILISAVGVIPVIGWIANLIGSVAYFCAPAVRWQELKGLGSTGSPAEVSPAPSAV